MPAPRKKRLPSFPVRSSGRSAAASPVQNKSQTKGTTVSPVNLEMAGDRLKIYSLQTLLTNKRSPETRATARLGDVLLPWFEKMVTRPAEKLDPIAELWQSLVPATLRSRCRLLGFSRGILSVALDSATIRAELDA